MSVDDVRIMGNAFTSDSIVVGATIHDLIIIIILISYFKM